MSSKVQQTFHQKLQKRKREKIFQIVFLLACQCVAVVQRFFVTRVVHCVTNSHNLKKYCACQKRVYYLVSLFCMCGLQCHTYKNSCNVRIALFEISAYHKIIQANGALNLGLFELKIKLLSYYYLQIIKIGLFVELQTYISVSYKFIVIFKFSCI